MRANRQPQVTDTIAKAAPPVLDRLEHRRGPAWLHAGAIAAHATAAGFLDPGTDLRTGLDRIAGAHPHLAYWGELAADIDADAASRITAFWRDHPLPGSDLAAVYTYPLGDAWQVISTEAVAVRAMCQTPWWVGELLATIAYDRALEVWAAPRVIDPACGTGHLLVEAFLAAAATRTRPSAPPGPDACLAQLHGLDLDPHAIATAAWRLLMLWRHHHARLDSHPPLADAPLHLAVADALLDDAEPLLAPGRYHVVLANPPYITGKDTEHNQAIRQRWPEVCHRRFSLALPFHARMMDLLAPGGWCAQLTGNAFMKREFGRPYVERFLPRFAMDWLIDTSGAYIPGHGTPTVIMSHRKQAPHAPTVHTVLGKQGEPARPAWPDIGHVAEAIIAEVSRIEAYERFARKSAAAQQPRNWHPT